MTAFKFKVGDRVRAIRHDEDGGDDYDIGQVGTVKELSAHPWVEFDTPTRYAGSCDIEGCVEGCVEPKHGYMDCPQQEDLLLVTNEPYFKIGDRVQVINDIGLKGIPNGSVGTVMEVDDTPWITFDDPVSTGCTRSPPNLSFTWSPDHMGCVYQDRLWFASQPSIFFPKKAQDPASPITHDAAQTARARHLVTGERYDTTEDGRL